MSYYIRCTVIVLTVLGTGISSYSQVRKLDRKKWEDLRKEIDKRRYDTREEISSTDRDRENRTYQDIEGANEWAGGQEREQDPNRTSDYSEHDDPDRSGRSGGYTDGQGDDGSEGDSNGERDSDIFDDNGGKGNNAEDELGNSTWDDDEGGNRNGGSRPTDENTYRTNPPERETSSRSRYSSSSGGGISSVWLYIILGVLVAFVLYLLLKSVDWNNKKVASVPVEANDRFENLEFTKSELELAIEKALAEGNYREAVRIYFLAVIKELRDRNLISWEKKKTNYSYLNEMTEHPKYRNFEFATRVFEVVWYGNRTIGSDEFRSVEPVYKDLLKDVSR